MNEWELDHLMGQVTTASNKCSHSSQARSQVSPLAINTVTLHEDESSSGGNDIQESSDVCGGEGSSLLNDGSTEEDDVVMNVALLKRIEYLEAENSKLKEAAETSKPARFSISQICHNDKLVSFYTGFATYKIFLAFFTFLGPSVNELNYWGSKRKSTSSRHRSCKLDPMNQLFLTLVKLRLKVTVTCFAHAKPTVNEYHYGYIFLYSCFTVNPSYVNKM